MVCQNLSRLNAPLFRPHLLRIRPEVLEQVDPIYGLAFSDIGDAFDAGQFTYVYPCSYLETTLKVVPSTK